MNNDSNKEQICWAGDYFNSIGWTVELAEHRLCAFIDKSNIRVSIYIDSFHGYFLVDFGIDFMLQSKYTPYFGDEYYSMCLDADVLDDAIVIANSIQRRYAKEYPLGLSTIMYRIYKTPQIRRLMMINNGDSYYNSDDDEN